MELHRCKLPIQVSSRRAKALEYNGAAAAYSVFGLRGDVKYFNKPLDSDGTTRTTSFLDADKFTDGDLSTDGDKSVSNPL